MAPITNVLTNMSESSDDPITPVPYKAGTKDRNLAREPESGKGRSTSEPEPADGPPLSDVEVVDKNLSPNESEWWKTATVDDIEATVTPITPVFRVNKKKKAIELPTDKMTRVESILSFAPPDLSLDNLRKMAVRFGIRKSNKMNKKDCLEALAEIKLDPADDLELSTPASSAKKPARRPRSSSRSQEGWEEFNRISQSYNDVLQYGILVDTQATLKESYHKERTRKRELSRMIADNNQKDLYKKYKANTLTDDITSSQEDVFEEVQELEEWIADTKKRLDRISKQLDGPIVDSFAKQKKK